MSQDIGDEVEVRSFVYFWDHNRIEIRGLDYGCQVVEGETCGYGVYAYGQLGDVWWAGSGKEGGDVASCLRFLSGGYGVFEVVAYSVYGERARLFEELGGGGGNFGEG